MPYDWKQADKFPFILAQALVEHDDLKLTGGCGPYYLLHHHQSSVRDHCFNVIWFFRKHANRELTLKSLFKNLADTLGFVAEAAGLARALFNSDEEFFAAASAVEPPENFADQYQERLNKLKEDGLLQRYQRIFLPLELKVMEKIEKTALLADWPVIQSPAIQLQLPVGALSKN